MNFFPLNYAESFTLSLISLVKEKSRLVGFSYSESLVQDFS